MTASTSIRRGISAYTPLLFVSPFALLMLRLCACMSINHSIPVRHITQTRLRLPICACLAVSCCPCLSEPVYRCLPGFVFPRLSGCAVLQTRDMEEHLESVVEFMEEHRCPHTQVYTVPTHPQSPHSPSHARTHWSTFSSPSPSLFPSVLFPPSPPPLPPSLLLPCTPTFSLPPSSSGCPAAQCSR